MPTKIYVGNLPWRATDAQLTQLFGAHGEVTDARIVTDRETGRSRGFGFVTMTVADAAQNAIRALNAGAKAVYTSYDQGGLGNLSAGGRWGRGGLSPQPLCLCPTGQDGCACQRASSNSSICSYSVARESSDEESSASGAKRLRRSSAASSWRSAAR